METDDLLVRRARQGDRAAFEELVRRTSRLVYAKLYLETGNPDEAEDLVQETYLRAFRAVGRVTDPERFRPWLLEVAQSAYLDGRRREGRLKRKAPPRITQEALVEEAAPAPEDPVRVEARDRIVKLLKELPEQYRLPIALHYISGEDYQTISVQLGLKNGALRGLLHRGLKLLRASLESEAYLP